MKLCCHLSTSVGRRKKRGGGGDYIIVGLPLSLSNVSQRERKTHRDISITTIILFFGGIVTWAVTTLSTHLKSLLGPIRAEGAKNKNPQISFN